MLQEQRIHARHPRSQDELFPLVCRTEVSGKSWGGITLAVTRNRKWSLQWEKVSQLGAVQPYCHFCIDSFMGFAAADRCPLVRFDTKTVAPSIPRSGVGGAYVLAGGDGQQKVWVSPFAPYPKESGKHLLVQSWSEVLKIYTGFKEAGGLTQHHTPLAVYGQKRCVR